MFWNEMSDASIIKCKTCGKRIWKYWHTGSKKIFPPMDECAPCHFNIYNNPLKIRKLSELEKLECEILLNKLKEDTEVSPRSQKGL
jgi:hypothetical protein